MLDADTKANQKVNFTRNLGLHGNRTIFLITEEANRTILDLSPGTMRVL